MDHVGGTYSSPGEISEVNEHAHCHPLAFRIAWYINLGIAYFHLFALILLLLIQSPRVTPLNTFAGYLVNATIVFLLWQTSLRDIFSCHVGITPEDTSGFLYTNSLAFPALEASLLAHLAVEAWERARDSMNKRHAIFFTGGLLIAIQSMFWFHAWWHIVVSLVLGAIIYTLWFLLLHRFGHRLPRSCKPPKRPTDTTELEDSSV